MTAVLNNVSLELTQGDDYLLIDQRNIYFLGKGVVWPANLAGVRLVVSDHTDACGLAYNGLAPIAILDIDGTYSSVTTSQAATASFDISRVNTLKLSAGVRKYKFEIRGLLPSASIATLARGFVTVLESQL